MDGWSGELGQDGMVSFPRLLERATPRQAGIVRFLQKPFDMATLAREVRAALDERPGAEGA